MSVLLTGAAGFIGSHVAERLLASGEEVVGLDLFDDFYDPRVKEANLARARARTAFHEVRGDIRDRALLARLPDHVDAVVHLAARAGVRPSIAHPELYASVNVDGSLALLELARARGIGTFVFASSSSVYGNNAKVPFSEDDPVDHPISPYAATKKAGELLCHSYHHLHRLGVVALRFFTAYGPRQRPDLAIHKFARLLSDRRPLPVFGDGSTARDYTYIDDVVDGVLGALALLRSRRDTYEIINLGESRAVTLDEMVRVLGEEMGIEPRIERLPMQPGDVVRTYADVGKARRLLGYDPKTDFRDGVRRFLRWFEEEGAPGRTG
jgi:UDP-glucuronate 4-epimerase